jgi:dihydropteroate synthase
LLVGASRRIHRQGFARRTRPAPGRIVAAHLLAAAGGAAIIRTHDVPETVQALRIAAAIRGAR